MPKVVSALTARTQFGQIMKRASENSERFLVGRRGAPKVIIMGVRDYIDTIAPAPDWLTAVQADAKSKGLDKLSMREIDDIIADTREDMAHQRPVRSAKRARRA
jgi:prevent-host-death family protein